MDAQALRVLVTAEDFARTVSFYHDILGLQIDASWDRPEPDGRGIVFRCAGGYIEVLDQRAASHVADVCKDAELPLAATPASLVIQVPDVQAVRNRLMSERVTPTGPMWSAPWGHRGFRVADPDGLVITVISSEGEQE